MKLEQRDLFRNQKTNKDFVMIERVIENIKQSLTADISVPGFINLDSSDCELAPGTLDAHVCVHSSQGVIPLLEELEAEWKELDAKDVKSVIYLLRVKRFQGQAEIASMKEKIVQALGLDNSDCVIKMGLILDDSLSEDGISISLYLKK